MALDIDLQDPSVQNLLGGDSPRLATGKKRELVQLAGDMDHGMTTRTNLDVAKEEVQVTYKGPDREYVLTVDVYRLPGEPVKLHLICPKCRHLLQVTTKRKKIEFDTRVNQELGGRLDVERFECTWENRDAGVHVPGLLAGGMTLCKWRVVIENNVARDVR